MKHEMLKSRLVTYSCILAAFKACFSAFLAAFASAS
jgi:hypothetical protein